MLWLMGDSIFRGLALGRFPEAYSPEEIEAEPLWPLRSPGSIINLLAGAEVARLGGNTGLPDDHLVSLCERWLRGQYKAGRVRDGDRVAFLDVGVHAPTPEAHAALWERLRAACPVEPIFCGGFDNLNGRTAPIGGIAVDLFRHGDDFNAAIQSVAGDRFLDVRRGLDEFARAAIAPYQPDGIHLNVWGQIVLAAMLARAAGITIRPGRVRQLVKDHWRRLDAPSRRAAVEIAELACQS